MAATLRQDLATPLFADVDLLGMLPYRGKIYSLMRKTEIVQAIASLRARGTDAHLWLPGGDVRTYGAELAPALEAGAWGTVDAGITVSGGVASVNTTGLGVYLRQPNVLTVGKTYQVSITGANTSGSTQGLHYGWSPSLAIPSGGTATVTGTLVATQTTLFVYFYSNTVGTITNLSVREITSQTSAILNGLTTGNYLESTGNSLATVDNPVGLVLDALGSVGGELVTASLTTGAGVSVTNADATHTVTFGAGGMRMNLSSNTPVTAAGFTLQFVVGKFYAVTITAENTLSTLKFDGFSAPTVILAGTNTYYGTATSTSLQIYRNSSATDVTISSISVREVSGIHLTQGTTANKGLLRRGAYNYLLNSVLAGGTSGAIGSGAVAPTSWAFGSSSGAVTFASNAVRFVATAQRPFLFEAVTLPVGTFCLSAKVVSAAIPVSVVDLVSASSGTGTVGVSTFKINGVASAGNVSTGDLLSVLVSVTVAGSVNLRFGVGCSGASTGDITLSQPQLETGSTASAYSPTTTAAASNPDAGKYSWAFDGSNDSLALGSVPFQMGDDWAVVAGIANTIPSGASWRTIYGQDSSGSARFQFYVSSATGYLSAYLRDDAGISTNISGTANLLNARAVCSILKRGSVLYLRVNGVQVATTPYSLGTTTFSGAAVGKLFVGADQFAGDICSTIVIKGTVSDADLLVYEKLAASAAGITI